MIKFRRLDDIIDQLTLPNGFPRLVLFRIRFVEDAGTVTTEVADPPAPPGNKPLVTVARRADGAPDVAVSGGRARVLILDPGDTGPTPAG